MLPVLSLCLDRLSLPPPDPSPLAGAVCPTGHLSAPRTCLQSWDKWAKDKNMNSLGKVGARQHFLVKIWKDYNEASNKCFHSKAQHKANLRGCSSEVTWLWPWPWQKKELESSSWHSLIPGSQDVRGQRGTWLLKSSLPSLWHLGMAVKVPELVSGCWYEGDVKLCDMWTLQKYFELHCKNTDHVVREIQKELQRWMFG